ncbi:retrovirus-related pol polyprotein from transposon TNT 1-94 [Tanacetum coccineum]
MVNTSLKKLKHHLAGFDVVVKERTMATAITEGSWGFEHIKGCFRDEIISFVKALNDLFNTFDQYLIDELSEVQNVFHQLDQAVEQHRLESKMFEVKMNQVLNENERLLEQVISKDIVSIIVNSSVDNASVNVHECEKCLKLETELLNKKDFIEKETYDKLFKSFTNLEKHCISLEVDTQLNQEIFQRENFVSNQSAPSFDQYFELNELKDQSQEKDTVIKKMKERIKSLSGYMNEDKVKKDLEEIETINIELEHRVSNLIAENEHLKQTYKQLYDSIKPARIRSKEQCDVLINQVNQKSVEISDLNAKIQEQGLTVTTLKDELRKLKGKDLADNVVCKHTIDPEMLKIDVEFISPRLLNNRSAHSNHLKHTQEEAVILREIVKQGKSQNPLNNSLDSACCTQKNKVEAHHRKVKSSLKNKDCVVAPKGTANVQHSKLNVNSELKCVKCNGCMLSDNHDLCVLDFINNVNAHKPTALESDAPKPVVTLVYSMKPRKPKTNVLVSKSKVIQIILWYLDSGCSKHMTRDRSQLTNFVNKFLGTVKFGNDHMANILGYGDYQIGNVTISRVLLWNHMRVVVASVNERSTSSSLSDDYSRFTWVKCLVHLNGTEVVNPSLREYLRRNHTLIDVARTILIDAKALLFLWAEAVAIACYTQNRSIIRLRQGKTPYELLHDKPPDLSFFHVFCALCHPTNDSENLGKLQPKADIGIFIGYAPTKKAFRIYNRRIRRIIKTIHVDFDELTAMASEHSSSGPALHEMTPATISSGFVPNPPPSTPFVPPSRTDWDIMFQPIFVELLTPPPSVDHPSPEVIALIDEVVAPVPAVSTGSPSSTTVDQDAPSPSNSQTTPKTQPPVIPNDAEEDNHDIEVTHMGNDPYFGILILEVPSDQSLSTDSIHTIVHPDHQISKHNSKWTKDYPIENIIGELDRPVSTRL